MATSGLLKRSARVAGLTLLFAAIAFLNAALTDPGTGYSLDQNTYNQLIDASSGERDAPIDKSGLMANQIYGRGWTMFSFGAMLLYAIDVGLRMPSLLASDGISRVLAYRTLPFLVVLAMLPVVFPLARRWIGRTKAAIMMAVIGVVCVWVMHPSAIDLWNRTIKQIPGDEATRILAHRVLLFLVTFAFLPAMYFVMRKFTGCLGAAVLTAVAAMVCRYSLGTSLWGMGEFKMILPRILLMPMVPLLFYWFWKGIDRMGAIVVIVACTGLMFVHLSALYLIQIFFFAYLFVHRFHPRNIWRALHAVPFVVGVLFVFVYPPDMLIRTQIYINEQNRDDTINFAEVTRVCAVPAKKPAATPPEAAVAPQPVVAPEQPPKTPEQRTAAFLRGEAIGLPAVPKLPEVDKPVWDEECDRALYHAYGWAQFPISVATIGFCVYNGLLPLVCGFLGWRRRPPPVTHPQRRLYQVCLWFLIGTLFASLGITAIQDWQGRLSGQGPYFSEQFRAMRFIYMPLFVYTGLFLAWLLAKAKVARKRAIAVAVLFGLLVLAPTWAVQTVTKVPFVNRLAWGTVRALKLANPNDPSQNRHLVMLLGEPPAEDAKPDDASVSQPSAQPSDRVIVHPGPAPALRGQSKQASFQELLGWADKNTKLNDHFLTTNFGFARAACRSIVISYTQRGYMVPEQREPLVRWYLAHSRLEHNLNAATPEAAADLYVMARQYNCDYILVPRGFPAMEIYGLPGIYLSRDYVNDHWAVYKVALPKRPGA